MTKLRAVFADTDAPLMVSAWVLAVISGVISAGLGNLYDSRTVSVSVIVGGMLGVIAASAPMFLALRLVVFVGGLVVCAAALGVATSGAAVLAGLAMAALAFASAVWTAVPVVGGLFSSLPVVVFIIVLDKGNEMAAGAPVLNVIVAGLLGMVAPAVIIVALSIRDPRKLDRAMTAGLITLDTPGDKRATYARVLLLEGAPPELLYLGTHGVLGVASHNYLADRDPDAAAMAAATANVTAVTSALMPRGPLTPREAKVDVTPMTAAAPASTPQVPGTWKLWAASQQRMREVLAGADVERVAVRPLWLLTSSLLRCLLAPDVAVFRYGVQRALALGVGAFALVASDRSQSAFWILLTMAAVLQANAPSTWEKVARRTLGTFVGVLAATALSLVLPARVLVPWLAAVAIVAGLAWMQRNYTVASMAMGFAMVLFYGAPTSDVSQYAVLRAVDVVIGGVIAALVARLVMPVRPRLAARRATLITSLRQLADAVGGRIEGVDAPTLKALATAQARVSSAFSDLRTDLALTKDAQIVAAYEGDLRTLQDVDALLFVLGVTAIDLRAQADDLLPMRTVLTQVQHTLDTEAGKQLPAG